jgi:hypothetical protein
MPAPKKQQKHTILSLNKRLAEAEKTIKAMQDQLAGKKSTPRSEKSLNKVESFNGEEVPGVRERAGGMQMNHADRMMSLDNTIRIMSPTYLVDGRHTSENLSGICNFLVTQEMLDEYYGMYEHKDGFVVPIKQVANEG